MTRALLAAALSLSIATATFAQDAPEAEEREPLMTLERMASIVQVIDPEAKFSPNRMQFTVEDVPVVIFFNPVQDRMRAVVAIRPLDGMGPNELLRVLQANFDTALDARYAIANNQLWATFIHPLSSLERDQLISGIGQTVNIARTYGTIYSGGALSFGIGDSQDLQRRLIEDLLEKGEEI